MNLFVLIHLNKREKKLCSFFFNNTTIAFGSVALIWDIFGKKTVLIMWEANFRFKFILKKFN